MKQEIELRAVTRSPIPLYPKEDTANAVRNIAMAEGRLEAERQLAEMDRKLAAERAARPYCSSSRADHMRGPNLIEFMIVASGVTAITSVAAIIVSAFS